MRCGCPAVNAMAPLVFVMEDLLHRADSTERVCRLGPGTYTTNRWRHIDRSQGAILTFSHARNAIRAPHAALASHRSPRR